MARLLPFLFCVFVFVSGFKAQNYRCISVQTENYFFGNPGFLYPNFLFSIPTPVYVLKADSFSIQGTDTTFHILRNFRNEITSGSCLDDKDTGFAGARIIKLTNGYDVFFNQYNDSVKIKTDAAVGQTFKLYTFSNGNYFEGTVQGIALSSLPVGNDSVKTISFQLKDAGGNLLSHPFNGSTVAVSKNYGIAMAYDWLRFPNQISQYILGGSKAAGTGIDNLIASEIFNFNIGDVFQFQKYPPGFIGPGITYDVKWYEHKVISKTFSLNADTVTYGYEREMVVYSYTTTPFNSDTTYIHDTIYEAIRLPGNLLNEYSMKFGYDSSFSWSNFLYGDSPDGYCVQHYPSTYNNRAVKLKYTSYNTGAGCVNEAVGWCVNRVSSFAEGLGFVEQGVYGGNSCQNTSMVYYDKGGETWGTPIDWGTLLNVKTESKDVSVNAFPNPAFDEISFSFPHQFSGEIKIINSEGKIVSRKNINGVQYKYSVSDLEAGIYFYQLTDEAGKIRSGKISVAR